MVDSEQQHELGAPPAVEELVPELADADLMASCDLRETCRKGIDALVRLYDTRYETRREDFLSQRKKGKPLSRNEVSRFHPTATYERDAEDAYRRRTMHNPGCAHVCT